jgi:hypothetical protein
MRKGDGQSPTPFVIQKKINENEVVFRNYAGERYVYKQPTLPGGPERQEIAAETNVVPIKRPKRAKKEGAPAKRQRKTGT